MVSAVNNQITLRLAPQIVGQYTVMTDDYRPRIRWLTSPRFPYL